MADLRVVSNNLRFKILEPALGGLLLCRTWRDFGLVPRDLSRGLYVARNYRSQD